MAGFLSRVKIQKTILAASIALMFGVGAYAFAQGPVQQANQQAYQQSYQQSSDNGAYAQPGYEAAQNEGAPYDPGPAPGRIMSANELATLLAPIALYPDGLLGQVLVACTYPEQVAEAKQFLRENGNLPTAQLMDEARQQTWDASVQLLVAFPDLVAMLNRDMAWTMELGNAFVNQQADVMNVVQSLRADAQANGQLASTPQLSVSTEQQDGRSAIDILPTDPQRMFVPSYDPAAVWGPPVEGEYPALPYTAGVGFADVIGTVANLAGLLPGLGLLGPRGWGWALGWLADALFVNNGFFSDFGFHGYGSSRGTTVWARGGGHGFGGRTGEGFGRNSVASGRGGGEGRGNAGRGEGWRGFEDRTRTNSGVADRNFGRSNLGQSSFGQSSFGQTNFGRSRVMGGENVRGHSRTGGANDWNQFGRSGQAQAAGHFGQPASRTANSQTARTSNWNLQRDSRSGGRSSYYANSSANRGNSLTASRSFGSGSGYGSFANSSRGGTQSAPRTLTASRSWSSQPNFSSARGSSGYASPNRGYSTSSRSYSYKNTSPSTHGTPWMHGSSSHSFNSSHSFKEKAPKYKAPKYKAPHYAKAKSGGHFSGGHSHKSHRG
jgi:hypothetical protein